MPTKQQVNSTIRKAIGYVIRMYKSELGLFGCYPSLPFRVFIHETKQWLKTGTLYGICEKVGESTYQYYFNNSPISRQTSSQSILALKVYLASEGQSMKCRIEFQYHNPKYHSNIFVGQHLLWSHAGGTEQSYLNEIKSLRFKAMPSNTYSIKSDCLAWKVLQPFYPELSKEIKNRVEAFGFTKDLYDPLFGFAYDTPYDAELYKDCKPAVFRLLPRGSSYHPYKSSVRLIKPYIYARFVTKLDPLCWSLEVINDFFKYQSVKNWHNKMLKKCNFDGYGIKGGLMKLTSEYSTLRLAVYMAANALTGQMDVGDKCADILLQLQWRGSDYVWAKKKLYVQRSDHSGGFYRAYRFSNDSYMCSILARDESFRVLQYFPASIQDLFPIPEAPPSEIFTDVERTLIAVAALTLYKSKKWGA